MFHQMEHSRCEQLITMHIFEVLLSISAILVNQIILFGELQKQQIVHVIPLAKLPVQHQKAMSVRAKVVVAGAVVKAIPLVVAQDTIALVVGVNPKIIDHEDFTARSLRL